MLRVFRESFLKIFPEKYPVYFFAVSYIFCIFAVQKKYRNMIPILALKAGIYCPHCGTEVRGEDFISEDRFRCLVCGAETDVDKAADCRCRDTGTGRTTLDMFCSSIL